MISGIIFNMNQPDIASINIFNDFLICFPEIFLIYLFSTPSKVQDQLLVVVLARFKLNYK